MVGSSSTQGTAQYVAGVTARISMAKWHTRTVWQQRERWGDQSRGDADARVEHPVPKGRATTTRGAGPVLLQVHDGSPTEVQLQYWVGSDSES